MTTTRRPATPLEELIVANLVRDTLKQLEIAPRAAAASSGALDAPWQAEGLQHDALTSSTMLGSPGSKQQQQDPVFGGLILTAVTNSFVFSLGPAAVSAVATGLTALASVSVVCGLQVTLR